MLFSFEGIEGTGKSTLIRRLAQWLRAKGVDVLESAEPGGTPFGRSVRALLLESSGADAPIAEAEFFLFQASRAQLVRTVLRPALERGTTVLLDRFWLSTLAYQCAGRGLPEGPCMVAIDFATGGLKPDLTFLLDVEPEVGLQRVGRKRGGELDRIERETLNFFRTTRNAFQMYGEMLFQPLEVIDTTHQGPDEVFEQAQERLRRFLGL